jgi:hypothetical protein
MSVFTNILMKILKKFIKIKMRLMLLKLFYYFLLLFIVVEWGWLKRRAESLSLLILLKVFTKFQDFLESSFKIRQNVEAFKNPLSIQKLQYISIRFPINHKNFWQPSRFLGPLKITCHTNRSLIAKHQKKTLQKTFFMPN